MDDKIKEVMGLVDLACKNHADAALGGIKAYEAIYAHKAAIESKLRELVQSEQEEVERMRVALEGLVDLGMSGESVLFTSEYDRARNALGRMPS